MEVLTDWEIIELNRPFSSKPRLIKGEHITIEKYITKHIYIVSQIMDIMRHCSRCVRISIVVSYYIYKHICDDDFPFSEVTVTVCILMRIPYS